VRQDRLRRVRRIPIVTLKMAARRRAPEGIFDTNVYIAAIRSGDRRVWQSLAGPNVWLSMVVVFELLAGARSAHEKEPLLRLVEAARRRGRLLVPTEQDWLIAAQVLERYTRYHGTLKPSDHVANLLIALGAARIAGEVVTANLVDFRRWARAPRRAGHDLSVSRRV
jgi:predicted nucleic acid-binding protein